MTDAHKEEAREIVNAHAKHSVVVRAEQLIDAIASALTFRDTEVREVLEGLGKKRQFDRLCFCDTVARLYCVGQPQCVAARALYEKLQPTAPASGDS